MGYFPVKYDSRVIIYEHKMFIRLATGDEFWGLWQLHSFLEFAPTSVSFMIIFTFHAIFNDNYLGLNSEKARWCA